MVDLTDNLPELLEGIAELDRDLADARTAAVERAVTEGAEEARTNHRFQSRTGATVAGIRGYVVASTPTEATGVLESTAETSALLNDGTRPHTIVPNRARALRFEVGGTVVFAMRAEHPGTAPDPFFDHGIEKAEEVLVATFDASLAALLGER
jgi:hypothetical protein